jgi:hypothetical protein
MLATKVTGTFLTNKKIKSSTPYPINIFCIYPQPLFYFIYKYGQKIHNQNSSEMSSLPFYLAMSPLEIHHSRNLKALYLLSKE